MLEVVVINIGPRSSDSIRTTVNTLDQVPLIVLLGADSGLNTLLTEHLLSEQSPFAILVTSHVCSTLEG
jgi:hypothetical protein